jgi:hypothetical protein
MKADTVELPDPFVVDAAMATDDDDKSRHLASGVVFDGLLLRQLGLQFWNQPISMQIAVHICCLTQECQGTTLIPTGQMI